MEIKYRRKTWWGERWFYTRCHKTWPHDAGIFSEGSFSLGFNTKKPDSRAFQRELELRILNQSRAFFEVEYE